MKRLVLSFFLGMTSLFAFSQTATNFNCNDCFGTPHDLFAELDAGNVIVMCWVMPCGGCVSSAQTNYALVDSYQASNPHTVFFYMVDDEGNTTCSLLNNWALTNGIDPASYSLRFSDSTINMLDYGTYGMPKTVVLGSSDHTVFYNYNGVVNGIDVQNAIDAALSATGINEPKLNSISIEVFPNPVSGALSVSLDLAATSNVTLQLFNLEGKLVLDIFHGKLNAGKNNFDVKSAALSDGMYLLKFNDGAHNRFRNVVIAH